jgi:hypothetical protein
MKVLLGGGHGSSPNSVSSGAVGQSASPEATQLTRFLRLGFYRVQLTRTTPCLASVDC